MQPVRLVSVRRAEISRQVNDKLSMHDKVVIGFFEVPGEHLCQKPQGSKVSRDIFRKSRGYACTS